MKKIEIKNRFSGKVIVCGKYENVKECLEKNRDAYLGGADLRGAYLGGAYLRDAYLRGAYLRGAYLGGADLRDAYLRGAYLGDAYLGGADLGDAYLRDAYLGGAYLGDAYLRGAYLRGAYLGGADLRGADLRGAYLGDADLRGAKSYSENHYFWLEIIRRQPVKSFTEKEWGMIGIIFTHTLCWGSIKKRFGKKIMPVFKKLSKAGFDEWQKRYEEVLKGGK